MFYIKKAKRLYGLDECHPEACTTSLSIARNPAAYANKTPSQRRCCCLAGSHNIWHYQCFESKLEPFETRFGSSQSVVDFFRASHETALKERLQQIGWPGPGLDGQLFAEKVSPSPCPHAGPSKCKRGEQTWCKRLFS